MFTLTLAQFEDKRRAEYLAESPEVTRAMYDEAYPRGSFANEWSTAIDDAVRNKEQLGPRVLDLLYREYRHVYDHLWHDYSATAFPVGYLPPDVRNQQPAFKYPKPMRRAAKCGKY